MAKSLSVIIFLLIATLVASQEDTTTEKESFTCKVHTRPDGNTVISNVKKITSKIETMTKDGETVMVKNETTTIDDRDEEDDDVEEDPVKWCATMFQIAQNFQKKWGEYVKENADDLKEWASENLNTTELSEFTQEVAEDFVLKWGNFMFDHDDKLVNLANNITHNNNNTWSEFVQGLTCAFAEKFGDFVKDNGGNTQDWAKDIKEKKGGKWLTAVLKFAKSYTKDWREYIKEDAKHLNDGEIIQSLEGSADRLKQLALMSSSALSVKLCKFTKDNSDSFEKWFEMLKRAGVKDKSTERFAAFIKEASNGNADKLIELIKETPEQLAQCLTKAVLLGGETAKDLRQKWAKFVIDTNSDIIGESIDTMTSDMDPNCELLGESVQENAATIKEWVKTIQEGGSPSELSEGTIEKIKQALGDNGEGLKKALSGNAEGVVNFFKSISQGLITDEQIEQFTELLKQMAINGNIEDWNQLMQSGSEKLKQWFKTLAEVDSDSKSEGLVKSLKTCALKHGKFDEALAANMAQLREYFKGVSTDDAEAWVLALKDAANSDPEKFIAVVKENSQNIKELFKNIQNVDAAEWILLLKEAANFNSAGFQKLVQDNSGQLKEWFKSLTLGDTLKQLVNGGVKKIQGMVAGNGDAGLPSNLLASASSIVGNNGIGNTLSQTMKLIPGTGNNANLGSLTNQIPNAAVA